MSEKFSQAREAHREALAEKIADARQRDGSGAPIYYIGGYCDNTVCDVRDVLYRVKDNGRDCSVKESRCPSCRSLLLAHSSEFRVDVMTRAEYRRSRVQS